MSALLLDLGNSRWKAAVDEGDGPRHVVSGEYDDAAPLLAWLDGHCARLAAVYLSSVAGTRNTRHITDVISKTLDLPVARIRASDLMPNVINGYRQPTQLGIDRLLAMVAARALTAQPLCVVDAGTAATIDFVDRNGQHLGGFILPGAKLFRECLLANTSIPRDSGVEQAATLGRDTPTAVALAGRYAVAGIVERFVSGSAALFRGEAVQTFVGGGDADELLSLMPSPCTKLDHLVLRGLSVVAASGDF